MRTALGGTLMKHLHGTVRYGACALALSLCLTACGNNSPDEPEPAAPAAIEGIATPSSVAVVTATNAD
jgi:hypothetical protein